MQRLWSKFSPVFRRFLISYLIVLLIPQVAGYASYKASIEVAKSSSIENSLSSLNLGKEIIERHLVEVEAFTKQLAINQDLYRLIADPKPLDSNNVYGLGRMQRSLSMYSSTNDYLSNFFIYIRNYNAIITPNTVYYRPEHYYAENRLEGWTFEEWEEAVLKKPHLNELMPLKKYRREIRDSVFVETPAITFLQSIPLNSFNNPQAMIGVLIDEDHMGSLLQNIVDQYGGWALVADREGSLILSRGIDESEARRYIGAPAGENGEVSPTEDGRLLMSIRSDLNGWTYMAGIPEQALMTKADRIKQVTITFTLAALVIGLLIGLLLAYRHSAPIHSLLSVFREQNHASREKINNEYDFLAGNIAALIANNKLLESSLNDQLPLLRDAFIKRLLTGDFYTMRELEAASGQTGVPLRGERGRAGILKVSGYGSADSEEIIQELSVARLIVRQAFSRLDHDVLVTDWGSDQIAFVHPLGEEPIDDMNDHMEAALLELMDSVYRQHRLSITIGLGSPYDAWNDVADSFNEAQQALEYAIHTGAFGMIRFEDMMKATELYYYPIESEQRMLNMLKAGELEEASRLLDQLFSRNFEERELSYEMTQQFVMELRGTFLKLAEQKIFHDESLTDHIKHQITAVSTTDGVSQLRDRFGRLVHDICTDIRKKRKDMSAETVGEIIRYIHERYSDAELTLYRLAEHIGKPEKYISQLFKEHTGKNPSDYVELVRIGKAVELLQQNHLTIDEIAAQVGYNSAHSFRRAFKRVRGVSPSAFRQMAE
ncbi:MULTISPECIES: helix-turn-helix domain-containing protein [unclassified Paenibacillus]|uniref:helix-turn-helix domain-containing protein n=1 Tax=unclassified Paenibacillus TaxID=185978 RepID=UPI000BA753FF|nr:helix-turn-helix domain-containing protein [Paenibacillus sp. 7541]PAK54469.1 AraC family transcriptional regulator [Paenibacillus sp. 7541]